MDRMSAKDALRLGGRPSAFPVDYLLSQLALLKDEDPQGSVHVVEVDPVIDMWPVIPRGLGHGGLLR
jgi:hypothetical protein